MPPKPLFSTLSAFQTLLNSVTRCCRNHAPNFIVHTQYTVGKWGYTYTVHSRPQSVAPQRVPPLSHGTFTGGSPDRHFPRLHSFSLFRNRPEMSSQNCSGSYLRKCESKSCCKTVHLVRLRFLATCCLPASAYRPIGNSPGFLYFSCSSLRLISAGADRACRRYITGFSSAKYAANRRYSR